MFSMSHFYTKSGYRRGEDNLDKTQIVKEFIWTCVTDITAHLFLDQRCET